MQRQGFSPKSIEYFERNFLDQYSETIKASDLTIEPIGEHILFQVMSLPKFWGERAEASSKIQQVMEDLISGFNESSLPLIFTAFGGDRLEICIGTISPETNSLKEKADILETSLRSSFHGVEIRVTEQDYLKKKLSDQYKAGLLTGVPSETLIEGRIKSSDLDRLMRGISGRRCGFVVVALPLEKYRLSALYTMVLNEIRIIMDSEKSIGQENPTVRQYKALLEKYLEKLQSSKSQGLWVSSTYLYADTVENLNQLKALSKSAYSGRNSVPDSIRALTLIEGKPSPGIIVNQSPSAPGQFQWPYMFSSVLGTSDLANLIQLPGQEHPGYGIKPYVRFNLSQTKRDGIAVGKILDQGRDSGKDYVTSLKGLKKHGLIVGGTGSGKTNTLFYLIRELVENNIPFLVIEPAKTEYRKLLFDTAFQDKLQVFTLGDNNISPFRLNPFNVPRGVPVQRHLDLLKSVFNASFYMWGPLPHVLEQCLYEIYRDKGWDLASNKNTRGEDRNAYPTLTDLYEKVDEIVARLGYSPETTMELRSSLKTRLNSLRIGGKGLMLDTKSSIDFEKLLKQPTILELETLGDDEEKSFIMGLILTMMYEHYVSKGVQEDTPLGHVTVIEEAHRLLGNAVKNEAYTGDMKGKAVETFTNILSEIRAYGEGFIVAEQIPTKLSNDVVKNTNLKVMHRIVADDDRRLMATSMNIKEEEAPIASTLSVGEALVYSEGDDGAYNIKVPYAKLGEVKGVDEELFIREHMSTYLSDPSYLSPYISCSKYCSKICFYKDVGESIRQKGGFSNIYPKLLLALIEQRDFENNLAKMFSSGNDEGRERGDLYGVKLCAAVQGAENYFEYLGRRYHWSYNEQDNLLKCFQDIYTDSLWKYLENNVLQLDPELVDVFTREYRRIVTDKQPTSYCPLICKDNTCQYRHILATQLEDVYYHNAFVETINKGGPDLYENLKTICIQAAEEFNPFLIPDTQRKIALCFALQKTMELENFSQRHFDILMSNLLELVEETITMS